MESAKFRTCYLVHWGERRFGKGGSQRLTPGEMGCEVGLIHRRKWAGTYWGNLKSTKQSNSDSINDLGLPN